MLSLFELKLPPSHSLSPHNLPPSHSLSPHKLPPSHSLSPHNRQSTTLPALVQDTVSLPTSSESAIAITTTSWWRDRATCSTSTLARFWGMLRCLGPSRGQIPILTFTRCLGPSRGLIPIFTFTRCLGPSRGLIPILTFTKCLGPSRGQIPILTFTQTLPQCSIRQLLQWMHVCIAFSCVRSSNPDTNGTEESVRCPYFWGWIACKNCSWECLRFLLQWKALKCKPSAHSIEMWNPYTSVAPPQLMVLTMHQKEQHVMHHFHGLFSIKRPALFLFESKNIYKVEKLSTFHLY